MRLVGSLLATTALVAQPAIAGDEVLYEAPPEWVDQREVTADDKVEGAPIVLIDQQARIESGQLWAYLDTAISLDSPQALTQFGTLSAAWLPDKGDLIVHRAELIREGEVIDLLDSENRFEVLRREQGLEQRLLDGSLTATMTVSGARLGDVVRLSYSTTTSDQAMGDNVQWQAPLLAEPFPIADGRVSISWPVDLPVTRLHNGTVDVAEPVAKDGFMVWSADLPVAERDPFPYDAPSRFQMGEVLQVTTYTDWPDVSSHMAQHYATEGTIAPGSDLMAEVERIAAASADPLTRAALALQLVQDDVSYLLNGLDGGNYLPQSPAETWENRFGDCKAKSVLLLAMLRELGVSAEVVLVATQGGDALPQLAPMPGNFDHMIVMAEIDGKTYWLDGTSSGTRLDTIDEVPRFHYALPLRPEGSELVKMDERAQASPDRVVRIRADQTNGVRLPPIYDVEIEFRGATGAQWRSVADQGDKDVRDQAAVNAVSGVLGQAMLLDAEVSYDVDTGIARISARAVQTSPWQRDDLEYELEAPSQAAKAIGFNADRARATWRDIPLRLNGPIYFASEFEVLLPESGPGFELDGETELSEVIGGVEVTSQAGLDGNRFTLSQSMRSVLNELPAEELPAARRALARFNRALPVVKTNGGVRELWEYFGEDRALLEPLEAFYAAAIAEADDDESLPLLNRAGFRAGVFDHQGALEDVNAALAIEASRDLYTARAELLLQTGDLEGALDDLQTAEDLQPDGSTYFSQVEVLALLGRADEAIELAEDYATFADDQSSEAELMANALGWAGMVEDGIEEIGALLRRRPGDGSLLNALCWNAGIWNAMNEERLASCVDAVEKSDYSAAALDSRALAHFRLGNLEAARADIDAALLAEPGLTASRLLRGIIKVEQGEVASGREDIATALAMSPYMERTYKAWGLEF